MPRLTANTISDPDTFIAELGAVRERGYATDLSESEEGASCVAVAIETSAVPSRTAISLSCPSARFDFDMLGQLVPDLTQAAKDIAAVFTQRGV